MRKLIAFFLILTLAGFFVFLVRGQSSFILQSVNSSVEGTASFVTGSYMNIKNYMSSMIGGMTAGVENVQKAIEQTTKEVNDKVQQVQDAANETQKALEQVKKAQESVSDIFSGTSAGQ